MSTPIFALCDEFVQRECELDPVSATYLGVAGEFAAGTDYSPDGHEARAELIRQTLHRLATLTPTGPADELAAAHLRERLEARAGAARSGEHLRALRAPFGLLQSIRNSVDLMPRGDEERWRAVVARVAARAGDARQLADQPHRWASSGAWWRPAGRRWRRPTQAERYAEAGTYQTVRGRVRRRAAAGASWPRRADAAHAAYAEIARWLRE